ncbi:hypothetical protein M409DRAFT_61473 [Zasmidium cellare ATCC 36951]|uniref:Uncharacterized protein n=1 Tax=Zasmidium cellare ATCC 36951 TaxID=1080233 RepID=A0A6A6BVR6_ZASCE|nr:uncharacterized protein M409DRAFT_61473 [Zasmidium cellare ATCC 36951]KAF2158633.1 hypothetical protein M409DRAFT_61473 [Zasmidium cellare ATCC 36951]
MSRSGQNNTGAPPQSGRDRFHAHRGNSQLQTDNTRPNQPTFSTTPIAGNKRSVEDVQDSSENERETKRPYDPHSSPDGPPRRQIASSIVVPSEAMLSVAAQSRGVFSGGGTARGQSIAMSTASRPTRLAEVAAKNNSLAVGNAVLSGLAVSIATNAHQNQLLAQLLPSLRANGVNATGLDPRATPNSYMGFFPGLIINCMLSVTAQDPRADPQRDGRFLQDYHDYERVNPTGNGRLDVRMYNRGLIGRKSSICLTEQFTIKANENVSFVGRLTERSTGLFLDALSQVNDQALKECGDRRREEERRKAEAEAEAARSRGRYRRGSREDY